jgi:hypothetical protein
MAVIWPESPQITALALHRLRCEPLANAPVARHGFVVAPFVLDLTKLDGIRR